MATAFRDPAWRARLERLQGVARSAAEGEEHFIQVSSCPLVSIKLITGDVDEQHEGLRVLHMSFVAEPPEFPDVPPNMREIQRHGYEEYLRMLHHQLSEDEDEGFDPITRAVWRSKFMRVSGHIDAAIRQYHGVKCYVDGDHNHDVYENVIIFHVCDIMTIFIHGRNGLPRPEVVIPTHLLREIPANMVNDLMSHVMTTEDKNFLQENLAHFYVCFAYYGNFSFVPIRTRLSESIDYLDTARFFMNNETFFEHQRGKLKELNFNNERITSRMCYRSI
jgi:hypothetical protein